MKYTLIQICDLIPTVMNFLYVIGYEDAYDNFLFVKEILRHYEVRNSEPNPHSEWGMMEDEYTRLMNLISENLQ